MFALPGPGFLGSGLLPGSWVLEGEWTEGQTDGRMENLPILQDFVPYWGYCPTTAQLQPINCIKRGKDTTDHMMLLGVWLSIDRGESD